MEHIFRPKSARADAPAGNLTINFGESSAAIPCLNCSGFKNAGMFIVMSGGSKATLLCIQCITKCIVEYQKIHPNETLVELDAEVLPSVFEKCVDEALKVRPDIGRSDMEAVVRAAIDVL